MTISISARDARQQRSGPKPSTAAVADEILATARAAVDRLSAEYPVHALRDIRRLTSLADRMTAASGARSAHHEEISRVAHDIRGQGTLFGYPLITRCADSLCRAARTLDPDDSAIAGLVRTHASALHAFLRAGPGNGRDPSMLFVVTGLEFLVRLRAALIPK